MKLLFVSSVVFNASLAKPFDVFKDPPISDNGIAPENPPAAAEMPPAAELPPAAEIPLGTGKGTADATLDDIGNMDFQELEEYFEKKTLIILVIIIMWERKAMIKSSKATPVDIKAFSS